MSHRGAAWFRAWRTCDSWPTWTASSCVATCWRLGGLAAGRDVLAVGGTESDLRRPCRARMLIRVRHGAYVLKEMWDARAREARHLLLSQLAYEFAPLKSCCRTCPRRSSMGPRCGTSVSTRCTSPVLTPRRVGA